MDRIEEFITILGSVEREGIDDLIEELSNSTFFVDPASANQHSNFEGGLCEHSINVYKRLKELTGRDDDTIKIVGLLHDVCKIGTYETYEKNFKDKDGKWNKTIAYKHAKTSFPFGHGEKSVYAISKWIKLTDEEALAIRWHMGAFEPKESYPYLRHAQELYPLVIYTHMADLMAATYDEKVVE